MVGMLERMGTSRDWQRSSAVRPGPSLRTESLERTARRSKGVRSRSSGADEQRGHYDLILRRRGRGCFVHTYTCVDVFMTMVTERRLRYGFTHESQIPHDTV
jgi:hypothetical protein